MFFTIYKDFNQILQLKSPEYPYKLSVYNHPDLYSYTSFV